MIVTAYYSRKNKILIISTDIKSKEQYYEEIEKNIIVLKNEQDIIIGINIFDYVNENLNSGLVNLKKIDDLLKKYFTQKIEDPFVVGKIKTIENHPKSEKLHICQVDLGTEILQQIVCGAKNVEEDKKVIVAKIGAFMPTGLEIKPSKLIDISSNGMICSYKELGYNKDAKGIAILDDKYLVGEAYYVE